MDDLMRDFLTEASENITTLDDEIIRLEKNPQDHALVSSIFRLVHTVKGTCGFLGLERLEKVAHAGENVLGQVRDGKLFASPEIVTTILSCIDRIKIILGSLDATGSEGQGDDTALIAALNNACAGQVSAMPPVATLQDASKHADEQAGTASTKEALFDAAIAEALAACEAASDMPQPVPALPAMSLQPQPIDVVTVQPALDATPNPAPAANQENTIGSQTIRVRVDLLESLMTMVSELVLTRNQLLQLLRHEPDSGFAPPLQRLNQVVSELQDGVMKARMQPIGSAWGKLPRLIRDLAADLGKKITLEMHGADTELDRQVLELIKDPLTHMIRNCADHGLETPADRIAAGKAEIGRILLRAYHQGGYIIIDIGDDGRGLSVERIRRKVLENSLATENELQLMSDLQLYQYIFRAGFSTAESVTSVSGRGVGMDVVRTNIEKIGGKVELRSTPNEGSTFQIKIPLTLSIVSALIVEANGERYAIPQLSVAELVRIREGVSTAQRVERIGDTLVLRLRNRLLPLIRLQSALELSIGTDQPEQDYNIIVTKVDGQSFGIVVDRVFDTEEIVVKAVGPLLQEISVFSGNTILGDGSVIMILDPKGLAGLLNSHGVTDPLGHGSVAEGEASTPHNEKLLIAKAGETPIAVRLSDIARLEECSPSNIEIAQGRISMQYRGQLMPLLQLGSFSADRQPILVFTKDKRNVGIIIDQIIDIVEQAVNIEWNGEAPGVLGSAVVAGRAVDLLDVTYHTGPLFQSLSSANPAREAA